jgi:hypothetical protein
VKETISGGGAPGTVGGEEYPPEVAPKKVKEVSTGPVPVRKIPCSIWIDLVVEIRNVRFC